MKTVKLGYVFFLAIVAALGGLLFGYDTAVISGTIDDVVAQFHLDVMQQGWYVGCALIGSICGVAIAGIMSDRLGRRPTMFISAALFTLSGICCAVAPNFHFLVAARIIGGLGIGIISVVAPVYISEISITRYRGQLVSLYQLAVTVGFLAAYVVNYLLLNFSHTGHFANSWLQLIFVGEVWRGMLGMEGLPALFFLVILFLIPESPRWLITQNKDGRAAVIFSKIYIRKEDVEKQVADTKSTIAGEQKSEWKQLLSPGILKAVVIGVCIAILGQFMGVNAVLYYGPSMFKDAGMSDPRRPPQAHLLRRVGHDRLSHHDSRLLCFPRELGAERMVHAHLLPALRLLLCRKHQRRGLRPALGDVSHEGQRTCNVDCRTVVVGGHLSDRTADTVDALHACAYRHIPAVCSDVCALHIDSVAVGA